MADDLTPERFRDLADAYGGTIARWPEDFRADAMRMAKEPAFHAILAEADGLDVLLDGWRVAAPGAASRARIERVAPAPRVRLSRRVRLWWSGLALATALAGATAGVTAAAAVAPSDHASEATATTAFGDLGPAGGQED